MPPAREAVTKHRMLDLGQAPPLAALEDKARPEEDVPVQPSCKAVHAARSREPAGAKYVKNVAKGITHVVARAGDRLSPSDCRAACGWKFGLFDFEFSRVRPVSGLCQKNGCVAARAKLEAPDEETSSSEAGSSASTGDEVEVGGGWPIA